jgi:hypothetical protein
VAAEGPLGLKVCQARALVSQAQVYLDWAQVVVNDLPVQVRTRGDSRRVGFSDRSAVRVLTWLLRAMWLAMWPTR